MCTRHEGNLSRKVRYFNYFRHFWTAGLDILYPPLCIICESKKGPFILPTLCRSCWQEIYSPVRLPLNTWAGGTYKGHLKSLIGRAKFQSDPIALSPLLLVMETLIRDHLHAHLPDIVISVPGSPKRICQRGINLPDRLARHIRRKTKVPYQKTYLERVRDTPSQQGLSHQARQKNLQGCFQASPGVRGHRVLLVDDVTTTGSTLEEAINTLKVHKPASITCVILAKTL